MRNDNRDFYCVKIWRLTSLTRKLVKSFFKTFSVSFPTIISLNRFLFLHLSLFYYIRKISIFSFFTYLLFGLLSLKKFPFFYLKYTIFFYFKYPYLRKKTLFFLYYFFKKLNSILEYCPKYNNFYLCTFSRKRTGIVKS